MPGPNVFFSCLFLTPLVIPSIPDSTVVDAFWTSKLAPLDLSRYCIKSVCPTYSQYHQEPKDVIRVLCKRHKLGNWRSSMAGMTIIEKKKLIRLYLGVQGGYLGKFDNIGVLEQFYIECGLEVDPRTYYGTNRVKFEQILGDASPSEQAIILREALRLHPPDRELWNTRTQELHDDLLAVADRLKRSVPVQWKEPKITSSSVKRAIMDAEQLIENTGVTSAVDRVHTMLHGYLRALCDESGIGYEKKMLMSGLFRLIRKEHPAFNDVGPRKDDLEKVFRAMSGIMDAMNPIRNEGSMAHPNNLLLHPPEAALVINTAKTILDYVDTKVAAVTV